MKVLLTGASGLLGGSIKRVFEANGYTVDAFERSRINWKGNTNNKKLMQPYDVIIHAAANTNVESCEVNAFDNYRDNAFLSEKLANASSGKKLVFVSSTGVYGNTVTDRPYHEFDTVYPTTHHHKAKLYSENIIKQSVSEHLIIRTGWLFGGGISGNDFVSKIIQALDSANGSLKSNIEQVGVPTYVSDVAERLRILIENDEVGIFNLVNEGSASRYSYVQKIAKYIGSTTEVRPAKGAYFQRKAQVSNNESAINLKMSLSGYPSMPNWEESLKCYIDTHIRKNG
jgi:dTDP-4-dehydrorhamnose reductase